MKTNELYQALKDGKTLIWESSLPRYYKAVGDKVLYSDDNIKWLESNLTVKETSNIRALKVL